MFDCTGYIRIFAVITNSKRVESPMKPSEAVDICIDFWECREIEKINPASNAVMDVLRLAEETKVTKGKIFDCAMAVTAKDNKVESICTENVDDFKKYSFLKVVNPFK